MPFVAIPSTVKLVIQGTAEATACLNILHYKYTGAAPASTALNTFVNAWLSAHKTQWLACHGAHYTLQAVTATDLSVGSGATYSQPVAGPSNVGTATGIPFPNNVALAVSLKTGLSGRRNRGRVFMGGLTDNQADGSIATGAFQTQLTTLFTALVLQVFTGGFDLAIASYKDAAAKVVTSFVIDTIMDSMRRRLPGRGI